MRFVQARNYTPADRGREDIDVVVVHTMESPEIPEAAERVAAWFAGPSAPQASAHYCIDSDSVVQCVREQDVAWAAPGNNSDGVQLEHSGYARQTTRDWHDAYSTALLKLSAKLAAGICARYRIPAVWLSPEDLRAGLRGITSHRNVSRAWGRSTHTDPGLDFPVAEYLALVNRSLRPRPRVPPRHPTPRS